MKQRIISIIAVLALCLSLLPTAWAEDETGVTFTNESNNVTLTDGKFYVAAADNKGITQQNAAPESGAYLAYTDGTLTVHGAFETTATIYANSDLTIMGDEGSSLSVTASHGYTVQLGNNSTLTLDGRVDFTAKSSNGPVIYTDNPTVTFGAADSYSGKIVLSHTDGSTPAVHGATLDVQNSGSIEIRGQMSTGGQSNVLNSKGNISIKPGVPLSGLLSIKGADVELIIGSNVPVFSGQSLNIEATNNVLITNEHESESMYSPAPALFGSAEISAGGNVTISSKGIPAATSGSENSLSVKNAKNVSITGDSSNSRAFFTVPVTFEKCGSVTVTDSTGNANQPLMAAGVTVTSDKPWTAKTGEKAVTLPSGEWYYGGDTTEPKNQYGLNTGSAPTCWKAGEGWIYYEPAADGSSPNKLTLDNATYGGTIGASNTNDLTVTAKGSNQIREIASTGRDSGSVTVKTEGGGTLNTIVSQTDYANRESSYTAYGKVDLPVNFALGQGSDLSGNKVSLTITQGAEVTIPGDKSLSIFDTTCLTNNGTIVNNGTVSLQRAAAENVTSETVKGLKLTGTGSVKVVTTGADGNPATDTYTNSGTKFLTPAGTDGALDLSIADSEDTANWATQGYKWTDVVKDPDDSDKIVSAKLTLAPGFNATSVKLPDAAVEIVTTGESRIGELVFNDGSPQKTKLTFSGAGPLTVDERINLAGGSGNTITVAAGAKVTANNGIYVGATGESSVTVNGILKAAGYHDDQNNANVPAVTAGKVEVSNTGVLEVSGGAGVLLNGMYKGSTYDFNKLFTVTDDGRFTADCSEYNIFVSASNTDNYPKDDGGNVDASKVIVLGDEYMPDDCEVRLDGNNIQLFKKGTSNVYSGPLTIHKNHTWETRWTWDGTTHWHACEFAGCTEKRPGSEAPHFYRSCVCTICGYQAPAGTPDSVDNSGGSSGSGSDRDDDSYTVTVEKPTHGTVTANRTRAAGGSMVTLTVAPAAGYALDTLTVTDSRGNDVAVTEKDNGKYTFTMPHRDVTVHASFIRSAAGPEVCPRDSTCPISPYTDASPTAWYHDGVHYCLENGLMSGYGNGLFGPRDNISRAQFAQILHNREDRPVVNYLMRFTDVSEGKWYSEAVRWAASEGVVEGYGDGRFGPGDPITREQLAVMLWRYAGKPAAQGRTLDFADGNKASGYAREALCWAVEQGIVSGKNGGILDPKGEATRAEVAVMMMRFLGK